MSQVVRTDKKMIDFLLLSAGDWTLDGLVAGFRAGFGCRYRLWGQPLAGGRVGATLCSLLFSSV
jgi:hypothetical protein